MDWGAAAARGSVFVALCDDAAGCEVRCDVKDGAENGGKRQGRDQLYGDVFERRKHDDVLILTILLFSLYERRKETPSTPARR